MTESAHKSKGFFGQTDLTQGKIYKTILRFSLPILISYFLQNLYSIADAAICGYTLSASEVAGVNDTGSISFLFLQFAFGCTAGMSVFVANGAGNNNMENARKSFAMQIVLSAIIVIFVTVISMFTIKPLLGLLGVKPSKGDVNGEVYKAAYTYIAIICGGMVGQYFYNFICCILRSIGDSFTPLLFLIISTVLNIALDLLFIMGFKLGVAGAAIATVTSQAISAAGCFIYTFVRYKDLRLKKSDFKFTFKQAMRTLLQGVPLGLQFSVLAFGILTMSNGVIAFDKTAEGVMVSGTPAQIGYGAACKIGSLFATPYNALGTAMISFCGQNDGAGNYERIRKGVTQALIIMFILSAIVLAVGLLLTINGAYQYIFLAHNKITPESIKYGNIYLYTVLPMYAFVGAIFVLRNAIQGLGKPLFPFLAGVAELVARIVICLVLPQALNGGAITNEAKNIAFYALSFADVGAWIAADIFLVIATVIYVYRRKPQPL